MLKEEKTLGYYLDLLKRNRYINKETKFINICFLDKRDNITVNIDELFEHPELNECNRLCAYDKSENSYLLKIPVEKISLKVTFPNNKEEIFVLKFKHYVRMLSSGILRDRIIIRPEVHDLQCYFFKKYPEEFLEDYMPKDIKLGMELTFTCINLPKLYLHSFLYDNYILDPVRYNILRKTKNTAISERHYNQLCEFIKNKRNDIISSCNIPEGLSDEDVGLRYIEFICQVPFFTYTIREAYDADFYLGKSYIIEGIKTLSKIF